MTQTEAELEQKLIDRLTGLGYEPVTLRNAEDLKANLKTQLEKHNHIKLSDTEFKSILNHLDKGNIFDRAKRLRDKMELSRDDGTTFYLEFLNTEHWCQNQYQVTNQVTQQGNYKNRYDVTLLINGLPLVQIELKRRGLELKEAFNQINRYQRHSYGAENGLFQYVQIFVISNGVNTRYYANNRKQEYKQTFYWADQENNLITQLEDFADSFLEKCHISKMICKYIVQHESDKVLMVLRPYQYYAVEAIIERVKDTDKNGYIWHTTGSGKTLTSFKAAQILTQLPKVHKVLFVVDRADQNVSKSFTEFSFSDLNLDEQTFEDYKSKYLDVYDRTRSKPDEEKESLVEEVDFELELIQRDEINVAYILKLVAKLQRVRQADVTSEEYQSQKASILELIGKEAQLRSKRDLLEKFIEERLPTIEPEEKSKRSFKTSGIKNVLKKFSNCV
ncbi:type I restriction endonuclease subunit R, EcoR124 family [Nostoc sp.]|uniref:type I restriction endonuclease subunit R, EcoR124 family n=1 Tax=Nostoc sp. TaxID=1180 RepID=UPI002FF5DB0B